MLAPCSGAPVRATHGQELLDSSFTQITELWEPCGNSLALRRPPARLPRRMQAAKHQIFLPSRPL